MRYVVIRDDDTCALTSPEKLERLYRPFLERGMPVNLATIPEVRTDVRMPDGQREGFIAAGDSTDNLLAPMGSNPRLTEYLSAEKGYRIVQHGCHHDYMEFDLGERSEAGRRLEHGKRRLLEAGLKPEPAFVAPYDRLSRAALAEVGARFPVLSTGWFEARRLPASWWPGYAMKRLQHHPHWRAGGAILLSHPGCLLSYHHPYDGMAATVDRAVSGARLTVLVTHWWEYFRGGTADEKFIGVLHEVAERLAARNDVKVVSFSAVANGDVPLN